MVTALPAHGQSAQAFALEVRNGTSQESSCWSPRALRERIEHYGAGPAARHGGLSVLLALYPTGDVELQLVRSGAVLARRRFSNLPPGCADRRDVVALSTSLAIEAALDDESRAQGIAPASSSLGAERHDRDVLVEPAGATASTDLERRESEPSPRAATTQASTSPSLGSASVIRAQETPRSPPPSTFTWGPLTSHLHGGARWLTGAAPSGAPAGLLGLELRMHGSISVDVSALASLPRDQSLLGGTVRTQVLGAELLGCRSWRLGDILAQSCAGAVGGVCRAHGRGYDVDLPPANALWAAGVVRLALRWPAETRLSLRLALAGHVNVVRPSLRLEGASDRLRTAQLGSSVGLDFLVALH